MFGAFAWDSLGFYNLRSLGHNSLEAVGFNQADIVLTDVADIADVSRGDEVYGYTSDASSIRLFYVTDVTDSHIALQDTTNSFTYIRDKESIQLEYQEKEE